MPNPGDARLPYKKRSELRSANNCDIRNRMAEAHQNSWLRRRLERMCYECLHNQHAHCSKDGCPCLCNDPR